MSNFSYPVIAGRERRRVGCFWAEPPALAEVYALRGWFATDHDNLAACDAAEYAKLAMQKWSVTRELGTAVGSIEELKREIRAEWHVEVTALLLLSAEWFDSTLLAFCLFHRTWANNLYVDFLAVHPDTLSPHSAVGGLGSSLLHQLCHVAEQLDANVLWGETSTASVGFYRKIFGRPAMSDRLCVGRTGMARFRRTMERKLKAYP